jgi:hypothetical protein
MSTSLRTRDGSFSVAAVILNGESDRTGLVPIELDGAIQWARENKVNLKGARNPLDRINPRRAGLGLPQFKIVRGVQNTHHSAARPAVAPPTLVPMISSERDLVDKIATCHGTLLGLVTPQIAEWLLKLNTGNRPLVRRGIDRFAKILRDGAWKNTGEPVIVCREGILNDGQHRLSAIHATGITADLDVRFGVVREAFHATGTGKIRRASQVLSIEGYSNTTCQASIARLMLNYDRRQMGNLQQVEIGDILQIVDADDRLCEIAAKVQRSKFPPTRTGSFGFVLVVAARTSPMERVMEFLDLVSGGKFDDEAEPTRRLHIRLRDAAMKRERLDSLDVAILTVKTWNAWLEGKPIAPLRIIDADRASVSFPQVRD